MHKLCVRCGVEFAFVPKGALSFGLGQTLLADPVCTHDSQIIARLDAGLREPKVLLPCLWPRHVATSDGYTPQLHTSPSSSL